MKPGAAPAPFWGAVDALAPWFEPYRADWRDLQSCGLTAGVSVHLALNRLLAQRATGSLSGDAPPRLAVGPLRFVAPDELPAGQAYEAFIHRTACVPTRDNLHDLLNGLVWLARPVLKARFNALQAAELDRWGVGPRRGPVRDALTLMDENGALLQAPAPLWSALRARQWRRLLVELRPLWAQARLHIVGHALLEQLATAPRKPLTAHVLDAPDALALPPEAWAAKPFLPLPVLGVPGWWTANQAPGFYDDRAVFRPVPAQPGRKPSIDR